jgi:hypothetical protein
MQHGRPAADAGPVYAESPHEPPRLVSEPPLSPLGPREEPLLAPVAEDPPAPAPEPLPPAAVSREVYRILLALDTGDRLEVTTHDDEASARAEATDLMRYLRDGRGDWPFVAGRFVRPERIVSIDVERS